LFDKNERYQEYVNLYGELTNVNGGGYLLCVASVWTPEKGYDDVMRLRQMLPPEKLIVMVGLTKQQIAKLPCGIIGLERTSSRSELAALYSGADVLVNPTWGDTFGLVNVEAMACGTPVVCYGSGGVPETVDEWTGIVVERGDVVGLAEAIDMIARRSARDVKAACRQRVIELFNKNERYAEYMRLYAELTSVNGGGICSV